MNSPCFALAILLAAAVSTGCTTVATKSGAAASPSPSERPDAVVEALNAQNPFSVLKRGMTSQQVERLVGAADEVVPFPNETGARSEIWVYNRSVPVSFREVIGGTRSVPYVDPITGEMKDIVEPIMRNELVFAKQRIELLMVEGLFVEWKQRAQTTRGIN